MRKLEKFKIDELSLNQQLKTMGGETRSRCSSDTCKDNCSDISTIYTRDDDAGKITSTDTVVTMSISDCQ